MFGGHVFEVENNNTTGLTLGDVLYFAPGDNDIPVLKFGGFDQFVRMSYKITVLNGAIASVTGISREVPRLASALSCEVRGVASKPVIRFTLPSSQNVIMELYTVLGAKVATLVNKKMESGTHSIMIDDKNLSNRSLNNGFYVVRLKAGVFKITKQVMLMK